MTLARTVTLCNQRGLHARASARFVSEAAKFDATVQVACDGEAVEADSALELMMFAAGPGTDITISASGPDAEKAVDALADLVNRGFDEED